MNAAAATAAMITCTQTGTPQQISHQSDDTAEAEHEEREVQREHLDDEEHGDQDQPADPSPLVDERDECREVVHAASFVVNVSRGGPPIRVPQRSLDSVSEPCDHGLFAHL